MLVLSSIFVTRALGAGCGRSLCLAGCWVGWHGPSWAVLQLRHRGNCLSPCICMCILYMRMYVYVQVYRCECQATSLTIKLGFTYKPVGSLALSIPLYSTDPAPLKPTVCHNACHMITFTYKVYTCTHNVRKRQQLGTCENTSIEIKASSPGSCMHGVNTRLFST